MKWPEIVKEILKWPRVGNSGLEGPKNRFFICCFKMGHFKGFSTVKWPEIVKEI